MSNSVRPQRRQRTRLPHPWDSPGKNTGVGCHFLLQCMKVKVKSLSQVLLFATPWTAAYQAPLSMGFPRQEYWSELPLPSPLFYLLSDFFFVFSFYQLYCFYQFYCLLCLGTDFLGDYCVWVLCASQICMYIVSVIKFGKFSAILFSSALFHAPFTMPVTPNLDLLVSQRSLRLYVFLPLCCSELIISISQSASSLTFFCHLHFAC